MQALYPNRINWENDPSVNTPLGATNLNKMDLALYELDQRVLTLYGYESRASASEQNAKTSEINAKVSETNAKQSELLAKQYSEKAFSGTPEGYEKLVEDVQLMDIQTTTDTTLYNSKPGGYKLVSMSGASEQKSTTGKQLLDETLLTPTSHNTLYSISINAKANTTYVMSTNIPKTYGGSNAYIFIHDSGTSAGTNINDVWSGQTREVTTLDDGLIKIDCRTDSTNITDLSKYWFMVNEGTTVLKHEPYTGAIASPNPSYPQSINNVGDCVEMIQGSYAGKTGIYAYDSTKICNKNHIPCTSGDIVKIEVENTVYAMYLFYYNESGYIGYLNSGLNTNSHTFTIPSGATYFNFRIDDTTTDTVGKISLTINGKYVVQISIENKNLWSFGDVSGIYEVTKKPKTLPIGTYTLSYVTSATSGAMNFQVIDGNGNYILNQGKPLANFNTRNSMTFTIATQGDVVRFYSDTQTDVTDIQLERGEVMTDYEEHKKSVATVLLNEPLRESDVMSRTEVARKRTSKVIDGVNNATTYINTNVSGINGERLIQFNIGNSAIYADSQKETATDFLITHFKVADFYNRGAYTAYQANDGVIIAFLPYDEYADIITDVASANAWLQENNVTVEYELAEEVIEELDNDSQIALNSPETFDTVTYINVDSRVKPSEIVSEYGTSQVGAYTLKALLNSESNAIRLNELQMALVALESEV